MRENRDPRSVFLWEAVCHTRHCTLKSCLAVTCPGEKKKKKKRETHTDINLSEPLTHDRFRKRVCNLWLLTLWWPWRGDLNLSALLTGSNLHTVDNHCVPCNVSNTCWLVHLQIFWLDVCIACPRLCMWLVLWAIGHVPCLYIGFLVKCVGCTSFPSLL